MKCLVLDAMGVIFRAADDVAELLIPFIAEHGGTGDQDSIQSAYHDASLGRLDADDFWRRVGLSPSLESEYLARFQLNPRLIELLDLAAAHRLPVWCLSNDVGRWSAALRRRFDLEPRLAGSVISGDVGLRKPDAEIYRRLIRHSGFEAHQLLFVDDRDKNVEAALALGIDCLRFEADRGFAPVIKRLSGVLGAT